MSRESRPSVSRDMWAVAPDDSGALRDTRAPFPARAAGEVLVRVLAAGLTSAYDSQNPAGSWPGAVTIVGTVEDADKDQSALLQREVAMLPPVAHSEPQVVVSEYLSIPVGNVIPVVPGRPPEEATLLHAAASVLGAVRQAEIQIGDSVAVLGTGSSAVVAAQWVRVAGAYDVYIIERDPQGIALARRLWLGERIEADVYQAAQIMHTLRGGRGVDVAIVPTGDAACVGAALPLVRPGGRVLVVGQQGPCDGQVAALAQATSVRLICGDDVSGDVRRADMEIAVRTWGSGRLALSDLITERVPLRDLSARLSTSALPNQRYLVAVAAERC